jgi:hypothetical protein
MNNKESFIKELRDTADFLEERGFDENIRIGSFMIYLFCNDVDTFTRNTKALGSFEKDAQFSYLNATRKMGANFSIQVTIARELICKKVVVGKKVIPAREETIIPEKVIPAMPEREEDIIEYECPESFMNIKREN